MRFVLRTLFRLAYTVILAVAIIGWLGAAGGAIEPMDNPIGRARIEPMDNPVPLGIEPMDDPIPIYGF